MSAESDIEKHKAYLLSHKLWITFVAYGPKRVNGKPTNEQALCVGVIRKLPDNMLRDPKEYWDGFNCFINRMPVPATAAMAKIPPTIFSVKTDVVETGKIVAV